VAETDDEQIEAIKAWLKENGKALIAGAVIAVSGVVGWQQWGAHQERNAEAASIAYMQLLDAKQTDADAETVERRGRAVMDDYSGNAYATMAALRLGEYHAHRDALEPAADALRWAMDNTTDTAFRHVARLRLAQVLLSQDKAGEAMALLDVSDTGTYTSFYMERRGDVHAAKGNVKEAIEAYDQALERDDVAGVRRELIRLKRSDLAGEDVA